MSSKILINTIQKRVLELIWISVGSWSFSISFLCGSLKLMWLGIWPAVLNAIFLFVSVFVCYWVHHCPGYWAMYHCKSVFIHVLNLWLCIQTRSPIEQLLLVCLQLKMNDFHYTWRKVHSFSLNAHISFPHMWKNNTLNLICESCLWTKCHQTVFRRYNVEWNASLREI